MRHPVLIAALTVSLGMSSALAQSGLDSLDESVVLTELARRNAGKLLEHAFEVNHTPETERAALRALMSLNELKRTDLSGDERYQLVRRVVAGLTDDSIRSSTDPDSLYEQATLLVDDGIAADINTLEYWGPTVSTQNRVKPVVEKAIMIADRAVEAAGQAMLKVNFRSPDDMVAIQKSRELEETQLGAQQLRQQLNYYLAIALDVADPKRATLAAQGIKELSAYDHEDNPARNYVRVMIGKMQSARMDKKGFDEARATFKTITDSENTPQDGIDPKDWPEFDRPNQFEARFFRTVNEIFAGELSAAQKSFDDLIAWEKQVRVDPATLSQWQVANQLLEYRLLNLQSQRGASASEREQAKEKGNRILLALMESRPDLQDLILSQLLTNIDPNAPVKTLDPLLLKALVGEGEKQVEASELGNKVDLAVLKRATEAAHELATRPGVDLKLADASAYREAVFLEIAGDLAQAAQKYLDFAENRAKSNVELASNALARGQRAIGLLREKQPDHPQIEALMDRVYPISIAPPFNQKQYTFTYAVRLQRQGKFAQAAEMFRSLPQTDEAFGDSRYWLMRADESLLNAATDQPMRNSLITEIERLVPQVRTILQQKSASAKTPQEKNRARSQIAYTTLLGARIAGRDQSDPAKTLDLLKSFDTDIAGLPEESALLGDAIFLRVQAYMALNRVDEATNSLLRLIEKSGGQRGGDIVKQMLQRLEQEFDQAKATGDRARISALQSNRAALTPKLVAWAETQTGPDAKSQLYIYQRYNAETQRLSADFMSNPSDARARREEALRLFTQLDSPEGLAAYRQTLTPDRAARARYDTAVALGLARLNYDLGNYSEARDRFGRLAVDKAMGLPVAVRREGDIEIETDNNEYWETIYKWIDSSKRENQPLDQFKLYLKEQYVRWGDRVGGTMWKKEFDQLRQELIPDFDWKSNRNATTVPAIEANSGG